MVHPPNSESQTSVKTAGLLGDARLDRFTLSVARRPASVSSRMLGRAMTEVEERIRKLVAENQQIDAATIRADSTFEELGIDSFDGLNLVFAVEQEFDVRVSDEQAKGLRSLQDVVRGVEKLLAAKSADEA